MAFGFIIAARVITARGEGLVEATAGRAPPAALPLLLFSIAMTGNHLWLLMQPMAMRL